jgi:HPt (histidine-containing phosphotransfer) domain-containing protein
MDISELSEVAILGHLQNLPGLDLDTGLTNLSGNAAQLHGLLVQFDDMFWRDINRLPGILARCDMAQAHSLIHTFKGAAGTLGLTALHERAISLETKLRGSDNPVDAEASGLAQALHREMGRFHLAMRYQGIGD